MKRLITFALLAVLAFSGTALATPDSLAVQTLSVAGITPTFSTPSDDSIYVANNGATLVEFKNTNGATRTVTIVSQRPTLEGYTATNGTVTLPITTGNKIIGPFSQTIWSNSSGYILIILSATADVTMAAFKITS